MVPKLEDHLCFWYVDGTLILVKESSIKYVLQQLNSFYPNIQFTCELEKNNKDPFLDVLIIRKHDTFETRVCRKSINTDIYLNWQSFAPNTWKRGTLKVLINRS